jgi:hypothetical protein
VVQVLLGHVWLDKPMVTASAAMAEADLIVKPGVAGLDADRVLEQADGFFALLLAAFWPGGIKQPLNMIAR